jgi:hypothetical protein
MIETIQLSYFLKTGKFGEFQEINFGKSRQHIIELLGKTDWQHFASKKSKFPSILKYRKVEFYFEEGENGRLTGIQIVPNAQEAPQGQLLIDYHDFLKNQTWKEIEQWLNKHSITYQELFLPFYDANDKLIKTEGKVALIFTREANEFILRKVHKFIVMNSKPLRTKQISISISEEDYELLHQKSQKTGIAIAKICSDIIANQLK